MDDKSIIELMKSRPDKGIYEAIRKYERLLTAIASRILSNSQDVEECVSDAFVGTWKNVETLQTQSGSLKGYLICAVRNNAINRCRKALRGDVIPFSDHLMDLASGENLENQVLDNENLQVMLSLIEELGHPDREIVIRKHFLYETVKEIAARLNMESNQIKYRLQKSKIVLREALEKRGIAI